MIIVIAFIATLAPSLLLFFWLRSRNKDKPEYRKTCTKSLLMGLLSTLAITGAALALDIIGSLAGLKKLHWLVWAIYKTFILFALTEETFKFVFFKQVLNKTRFEYSWYDVTAFMTLVGTGFGMLESVLYSLDIDVISAIVRGVTLSHGVYGFIMGYFYAKALKTGKKFYYVLSFLIPYLLHAIYDFGLVPELLEFNDNLAVISVLLALADLVIMILMIVFFARRRKNERYNSPLTVTIQTENAN